MWTGEGWTRTQRKLGVAGLVVSYVLEAVFPAVNVPIAIYSILGGLLGLDILVDALERLKK